MDCSLLYASTETIVEQYPKYDLPAQGRDYLWRAVLQGRFSNIFIPSLPDRPYITEGPAHGTKSVSHK